MTNTLDEDWRSIPGFPGYSASSVGRVRSEPRTVTASNGQIKYLKGCVLRPAIGTTGYKKVALRAGNRSISVKVHQLVALAFIGEPPVGHLVRHIDGDPLNNCPPNLVYGTQADNMADARRHGRIAVGEARHWKATITLEQAKAIAVDIRPAKTIAREMGIGYAVIENIRRGHTWPEVQHLRKDMLPIKQLRRDPSLPRPNLVVASTLEE